MAIDVALWFVLAGMIGLMACGCILTAPSTESTRQSHGHV